MAKDMQVILTPFDANQKAGPKPTIWCLFSVECQLHDQPDNNLVTWWASKPSIEKLAKFMTHPLDKADDETVVKIVNLWQGQRVVMGCYEAEYRLQEVKEGDAP